jgi:hypothetical protein
MEVIHSVLASSNSLAISNSSNSIAISNSSNNISPNITTAPGIGPNAAIHGGENRTAEAAEWRPEFLVRRPVGRRHILLLERSGPMAAANRWVNLHNALHR